MFSLFLLRLRENNYIMDNFTYVTLLSNSSLKYYPENTLSRFTVKLPNTINFDSNEKWYVGLTNVTHTSIRAQQKTQPIKIKIKSTGKQGFLTEKLINLLNAAPDFYQKVKEKNFFDRYKKTLELKKYSFVNGQPFIQIKVLPDKNIIIICDEEYTPRQLFDIIFSQIKKEKWDDFIKSFQEDIKNFKETKEIKNKIQKIKDEHIEEIAAAILTSPLPFYICFYTDIIKPRIIGDTEARCLYMSPLGTFTDRSKALSYEIDNVQYCPIEKYNISEINILIADENGEQINFEDGLFMTCLVLHFKKGI